jgi:spore coat protein U domain-containing protein, fimbrial subunit CupE1/2/3/6
VTTTSTNKSPLTRCALVFVCAAGWPTLGVTDISAQGTASQQLQVLTTVVKRCTITTTDVTFAPYDPVVANNATPLDGAGAVTVTCTQGTIATIALDPGSNAQGTTRRMAGGAQFLSYELYKDAGRSTTWGATGAAAMTLPAAPSLTPRTFPVYGRVPPAQDVASGAYLDRALATVNF